MIGKALIAWGIVGSLAGFLGCRAGLAPEDSLDGSPEASRSLEAEGGPSDGDSGDGWVEAVDSWIYGELYPREASAQSAGDRPARSAQSLGSEGLPGRQESGQQQALQRKLREAAAAIRDGRLTEAVDLLESAEGDGTGDGRRVVLRALGDAYLALRRNDDAAATYRELLALESRGASAPSVRADVRGNLAVAYVRLGDLEAARRSLEEALVFFPGHPEALKTLGIVDILQGNVDAGRRRLEESLRGGRRIPEAELMLARLDEQGGRWELALVRYRELASAYERELPRDTHRRWRDLLIDEGPSTPDVLAARIRRLEVLLGHPTTENLESQDDEAREIEP